MDYFVRKRSVDALLSGETKKPTIFDGPMLGVFSSYSHKRTPSSNGTFKFDPKEVVRDGNMVIIKGWRKVSRRFWGERMTMVIDMDEQPVNESWQPCEFVYPETAT